MKAPTLWKRWVFGAAAVMLLADGWLTLTAVRAKDRVEELRAIQAQMNDEMRSFIPALEEANIFVDGPEAFRHSYVLLEGNETGGLS